MEKRMQRAPYSFTVDYFEPYEPLFKRWLAPLVDTPCAVLEIGAYEGRSSTWLADFLLGHPGATLDCIDVCITDRFLENIRKTDRDQQIRVHEGTSRSILPKFRVNSYDFVYVDGSHSTADVLEDAVFSFGLMKLGGVIAFDDYLWDDPEHNQRGTPRLAINAFLAVYSRDLEVLHKGEQVWARKIGEPPEGE
jgi:predicted O-methyltransferase YrrM